MSLRPAQSLGRHPLSRSYRANLPSSLNTINSDTPSPSQRGAPVSVLGTDCIHPFHGLLEFALLPHNGLTGFSPLRYSTSLYRLDGTTVPLSIPGSVRIVWSRYRNINLFPFRYARITAQPKFSFLHGPQDLTTLLPPMQNASLRHHTYVWSVVSVAGLSPVHFQRPES